MRLLERISRPAGSRIGRAGERTGWLLAVLALQLSLTVVRHEALHIVGGLATGGRITHVEWLPRPWTLGLVEVSPPLGATPAAYYVPLLLPYLADLLLIVLGLGFVRRLRLSPGARRLIVQHTVVFAALDVLVNVGAAFAGSNDWALILAGWGGWRHAILGAIAATCLAAIAAGRRASRGGATTERHIRWIPAPAPVAGVGGRSR